ncbi:reverse transcriptase [Plakobranchus ocellatus]|uniref:Reverse transcriptase n=1 Tax=Plakobranchus ocellatus TaxID=259542 RepID=A0AAV4AYL5_9GAST|nr:reverse transcriptase [Plakobranchus ocellatus]
MKQVVLPKLFGRYVMSVVCEPITGARLGIRRTKECPEQLLLIRDSWGCGKILPVPQYVSANGGAARVNTFCPVRAALRENYTWLHAYLEGVVDERDPGARCEFKLRVLNLRKQIDDTVRIAREELQKDQIKHKHHYDRTARRRKFCVGDKVLIFLLTESNNLLMQWK